MQTPNYPTIDEQEGDGSMPPPGDGYNMSPPGDGYNMSPPGDGYNMSPPGDGYTMSHPADGFVISPSNGGQAASPLDDRHATSRSPPGDGFVISPPSGGLTVSPPCDGFTSSAAPVFVDTVSPPGYGHVVSPPAYYSTMTTVGSLSDMPPSYWELYESTKQAESGAVISIDPRLGRTIPLVHGSSVCRDASYRLCAPPDNSSSCAATLLQRTGDRNDTTSARYSSRPGKNIQCPVSYLLTCLGFLSFGLTAGLIAFLIGSYAV